MLHGIQVNLQQLLKLRHVSRALHLMHRKSLFNSNQGLNTSGFRGRGMDFDEVRVYQAGDDIRAMDWRVTARTGKPHTKLYKEERERPFYVIVDYSPSMQFGTRNAFKSVIAAEAAALVAWAVVEQGDRIGAIITSGATQIEIKPTSRDRGVLAVLKLLASGYQQHQQQEQGLVKALHKLKRVIRPGSVVYIFSDFYEVNTELEQAIAQLAPHNELVAGFIYDQLEMNLPRQGQYGFSNGHNLTTINTNSQKLKAAYQQQFQQRQQALQQLLYRYKTPLLSIATHDDIAKRLRAWTQ